MRVFISAGEVSGDIVAGKLIHALRAQDPDLHVDAIGGPRMADAGATLLASATHIGAIGVSEGLAVAPTAVRLGLAALRHCRRHQPDVAVLVGNDIFNVIVGRRLRAAGMRTIGYFPPQTWIWAAIARLFAPSFSLILASFPDEVRCYGRSGVSTEFVGHYLADLLTPPSDQDRLDARTALGLRPDAPVVVLLAGSRHQERRRLLPVLLETVDRLRSAVDRVQCLFVGDSGSTLFQTPAGYTVPTAADSHLAMRAADVGVLCSGTATLEAALLGLPMVVAYRCSWSTYAVVRSAIAVGLIREEMVALPNLIVEERVVPEYVQSRLSAAALATEAVTLLESSDRRHRMLSAFDRVRAAVARAGSLDRAAAVILQQGRQQCHM